MFAKAILPVALFVSTALAAPAEDTMKPYIHVEGYSGNGCTGTPSYNKKVPVSSACHKVPGIMSFQVHHDPGSKYLITVFTDDACQDFLGEPVSPKVCETFVDENINSYSISMA